MLTVGHASTHLGRATGRDLLIAVDPWQVREGHAPRARRRPKPYTLNPEPETLNPQP